jgi:hypothetical protein
VRTVEYVNLLNPENRVRIRFDTEHGQVLKFVVQLECWYDAWTPVIRYDTAHGFAHCDIIFPRGDDHKLRLAIQDFDEALTYVVEDIAENWSRYRDRYEEWQ